jgi:hypothetical protein
MKIRADSCSAWQGATRCTTVTEYFDALPSMAAPGF